MRKRSDRLPNSKRILIAAFIAAIVILISFICIERRVRRFSAEMGSYYCHAQLSSSISESVQEVLQKTGAEYSDLSCEVYDENGKFISAEINSRNLNALQSMIITEINENIGSLSECETEVSAGTLSGVYLLNGKGPKIKFRLVPAGSVQAELKSSFESGGINQTCHKISLYITAEAKAVYPTGSKTVTVKMNCILAENIIAGKVPDGFRTCPHGICA